MITLLAACSHNNIIGHNGRLPWRRPEDLRYFREQTLGKTVLMGRRTWESLGSRPLQGRHNLVVTSSREIYAPTRGFVTRSFAKLADALKFHKDVIVIGGGEIYRQCLPLASVVDLTRFDFDCDGDVTFPELPAEEWRAAHSEVVVKGTRWRFERCGT